MSVRRMKTSRVLRRVLAGILMVSIAMPNPAAGAAWTMFFAPQATASEEPAPAPAGECLRSANAVWQEHPGSRASWEGRSHPGRRCWFAKEVMPEEQRGAGKSARRAEPMSKHEPRHEMKPRASTSPELSSKGQPASYISQAPPGAVPRFIEGWRGARIAVMPEEDPFLFHWTWGGNSRFAAWEPLYAARERRARGQDALAASKAGLDPKASGPFVTLIRRALAS